MPFGNQARTVLPVPGSPRSRSISDQAIGQCRSRSQRIILLRVTIWDGFVRFSPHSTVRFRRAGPPHHAERNKRLLNASGQTFVNEQPRRIQGSIPCRQKLLYDLDEFSASIVISSIETSSSRDLPHRQVADRAVRSQDRVDPATRHRSLGCKGGLRETAAFHEFLHFLCVELHQVTCAVGQRDPCADAYLHCEFQCPLCEFREFTLHVPVDTRSTAFYEPTNGLRMINANQ